MQQAYHSAKTISKDVATHASSAVMYVGHRVVNTFPTRHNAAVPPNVDKSSPPPKSKPSTRPTSAAVATPPTYSNATPSQVPSTGYNADHKTDPSRSVIADIQPPNKWADPPKKATAYVSPYAPPAWTTTVNTLPTPTRPAKSRDTFRPRSHTNQSARHVVNSRAFVHQARPVLVLTKQLVAVRRLVRAWRAYSLRKKRVHACIILQSLARGMVARRRVDLLRAPSAISFDDASDRESCSSATSFDSMSSDRETTAGRGGMSWADDDGGGDDVEGVGGDGDTDSDDCKSPNPGLAPRSTTDQNNVDMHAGVNQTDQRTNHGHLPNDRGEQSVDVLWNRRTQPVLGLTMAWNAGLGVPVVQTVSHRGNDIPGRNLVQVKDCLSHVQNTPMDGVRAWRATLKDGEHPVVLRFQRSPSTQP